mgnify:CR=1 FL=1
MPKISKQKFYEMYTKELFPVLQKYEKIRKSMFNGCVLCEILLLCFLNFFIWRNFGVSVLFGSSPCDYANAITFILLVMVVAIYVASWIFVDFNKKYKQELKDI